ncbi:PAS domain-containing protein [Desulfamplus magnetovallimortis]|nr:PAS domain S-box protein [Desulfamplus magnetovallimortis]
MILPYLVNPGNPDSDSNDKAQNIIGVIFEYITQKEVLFFMSTAVNKAIELETIHAVLSKDLADAVWSVDVKTLTYEYISRSIINISGYSAEEYIGQSVHKTMSQDTFGSVFKILSEEISSFESHQKKIRNMELELIHRTGRFYWVEIRAKLYKSPEGGLKVIGVSRDVTDRKKAEQEKEDTIVRLGKMIAENERLLKENRILTGLLPICSGCKRIRDDNNKWWPLEAYVREHTDADFTHTICTDCSEIFYK